MRLGDKMSAKEEIINMLNRALEMEHAAQVQYLSHAELLSGPYSEQIIERLQEIAGDEIKHAATFRKLIGDYLGGVPSMKIDEVHQAKDLKEIIKVNIEGEIEAIEYYKKILEKVNASKDELKYEYFRLEHDIRHIIMDEQEHLAELKRLQE